MIKKQFITLNKAFYTATEKIISTMVTPDISLFELENNQKSVIFPNDVIGSIDISGTIGAESFRADMQIYFSKETYLKVASKMLMEEFSDINDENDDVASELANMIAGNAKGQLTDSGFKLSMSSPQTWLKQEAICISDGNYQLINSLKLSSELGDIFLSIGVE